MKWRDIMNNETLRNIENRRSYRLLEPEQLRDNELRAVIEAGLCAPSAMNQQPWHFTVILNKDVMKRLEQDVREYLLRLDSQRFQHMAKEESFNMFHNAPTIVLISGDANAIMPEADCAAAAQNMLIAAESIGIGSCWVDTPVHLFRSDGADRWKRELGIPENYKPLYCVAIGYKPSAAQPDAPKRKEDTVNYIN
jgi:nitroreductase